MDTHSITSQPISPLPPDALSRNLIVARPESDQTLPHIGMVSDTYTILLSGENTDGRYCLIDMLIPPGGGPGPHRHDFEETFILSEGEIEATFRGQKSTVKAGETLHIPANAPHEFHNASDQPVRLLCICSASGKRSSSNKQEERWKDFRELYKKKAVVWTATLGAGGRTLNPNDHP